MDIKTINEELSVSGQLSIDDIDKLKQAGVKSIICNRPDNEDPGQLSYQSIEQIAKEKGLEFRFMPVVSGQVSVENGIEFGELTKNLPKPVHAYCRSGTRCTTLWAISQLKSGVDKDVVLSQAAKAGYDLSKVFQ
jgi:sulfide:quinone oxidoreductase